MREEPESRSRSSLDVAIIGKAGHFSGAPDLEAFWRILRDGVECISTFSDQELAAEGVDPALLQHPAYVKARGVLAGAELFDADFFGYSPREAELMDPQQRRFLECASEALEDAGYHGQAYPGLIGVYGGAALNTYLMNLVSRPDLVELLGGPQTVIASSNDFLCTRVSYKLNLQGPSVTVQTACSTSLVAVHLACQALLGGDCDMALAGGVSIRFPQKTGYMYKEGGILSSDGHCRAFDARASGSVGGAGVGVVVLKVLVNALEDGDSICAVIKGSAINNDGSAKAGYTAPRMESQTRVIRAAQILAEVEPETITYVEAHGTGTKLGDPIELAALIRAFREGTERKRFCAIGSVKTNIGHLDAAAGIAGLIKTVLALENRALPPSLHFEAPNPEVDLDNGPLYLSTRLSTWPEAPTPRRAGVSSFGLGGTNAHVVLEEAPKAAPTDPGRPWQLLLLSARTKAALETMTDNLAAHLSARPDLDLADVAYTLQRGRQAFEVRRTLVCRSREDAALALRGRDEEQVLTSAQRFEDPPVAFLFPGLGDHYGGMGRGLYESEPVFREEIDRGAAFLAARLEIDLRNLLYPDQAEDAGGATKTEVESRIDLRSLIRPGRRGPDPAMGTLSPELVQPALFLLEYALARLWQSWGVQPQAMIGYSLGEYVAACLAGVWSPEDALTVVAHRAHLISTLPAGGMTAVLLSERQVAPYLGHHLSLAAVNGPSVCVVGGPLEPLAELERRLTESGVSWRRLETSHAVHSQMMEPLSRPLLKLLRGIELRPPGIPYLSGVTGTWITAAEATDPAYWVKHLCQTVRFAEGIGELWRQPGRILLEVGPGRSLGHLALQSSASIAGAEHAVFSTLRSAVERQSDQGLLLQTLGQLWLAGVPVDWAGFQAREQRRRVPLPTYPFQRQRCWIEPGQPQPRAAPERTASQLRHRPLPASGNRRSSRSGRYVAPRNPLETEVAEIWRELLGVEQVGIEDNFFAVGGSSLLGVGLGSRLQQRFQVDLPPEFLFRAPTIAAMAELVAAAQPAHQGLAATKRHSFLVEMSKGNGTSRPAFYLVHPLGGHLYLYRDLAAALGEDRAVYGLRACGFEDGEQIHRSIEEMSAEYVAAVMARQPEGPYLLGGSSMGGMIAFEMAQQLRGQGREVALLAMLDTPGPDQMPPRPADDAELLFTLYGSWLSISLEELRRHDQERWVHVLLDRARSAKVLPPGFGEADLRRHLEVVAALWRMQFDYQPLPYPGSVLFLRAMDRSTIGFSHPERAWLELVLGGTEFHLVPGDHTSMHHPPHLEVLAERLRTALDRAQDSETTCKD
jgi:phthiocerol/phenolphthiocerol synthesis type-I polyketide synthase E